MCLKDCESKYMEMFNYCVTVWERESHSFSWASERKNTEPVSLFLFCSFLHVKLPACPVIVPLRVCQGDTEGRQRHLIVGRGGQRAVCVCVWETLPVSKKSQSARGEGGVKLKIESFYCQIWWKKKRTCFRVFLFSTHTLVNITAWVLLFSKCL